MGWTLRKVRTSTPCIKVITCQWLLSRVEGNLRSASIIWSTSQLTHWLWTFSKWGRWVWRYKDKPLLEVCPILAPLQIAVEAQPCSLIWWLPDLIRCRCTRPTLLGHLLLSTKRWTNSFLKVKNQIKWTSPKIIWLRCVSIMGNSTLWTSSTWPITTCQWAPTLSSSMKVIGRTLKTQASTTRSDPRWNLEQQLAQTLWKINRM